MRIRTLLTTASAMALSFGVMAGAVNADDNSLFVEQVGTANFGGGFQATGNNNEGYIQADGNANTAGFSLTKPGAGVANRNDTLIKVTGNQNIADWGIGNDQDGQMLRNDIGLVVNGAKNYNKFIGTGNFNTDLIDTTIFVEQTGNFNYASDVQSSGGSEATGNGNHPGAGSLTKPDFSSFGLDGPDNATFQAGVINGTGHFIGLRQDGDNNAMQMSVTGSNNTIRGFGTDPGSASQGTFNAYTSTGFFDSDTPFESLNGTLAHQNGNNNVGVVQVSGMDNDVQFAQTGDFNTAEVYQQGNGNTTWVGQ
jgi:hypothetical protein